MGNIGKIIIATDFSSVSQVAVRAGFRLASEFGSHILLVHVVEELAEDRSILSYRHVRDKVHKRLEEEAAQRLEDLGADLSRSGSKPVKVTTRLVVGKPRAKVHELAHTTGAHLLVLGTHSREGVDRLFLGSVAEKAVRKAPCPVLVVKGETDREFKRMVIATDLSEASENATRFGFLVARRVRAEVYVLNILETRLRGFFSKERKDDEVNKMLEEITEERRKLIDEQLDDLNARDLNVTPVVHPQAPVEGILEKSAELDADVIVMATHGYGAIKHTLVGSVAQRVVREADRPILVIKPKGYEYN